MIGFCLEISRTFADLDIGLVDVTESDIVVSLKTDDWLRFMRGTFLRSAKAIVACKS